MNWGREDDIILLLMGFDIFHNVKDPLNTMADFCDVLHENGIALGVQNACTLRSVVDGDEPKEMFEWILKKEIKMLTAFGIVSSDVEWRTGTKQQKQNKYYCMTNNSVWLER